MSDDEKTITAELSLRFEAQYVAVEPLIESSLSRMAVLLPETHAKLKHVMREIFLQGCTVGYGEAIDSEFADALVERCKQLGRERYALQRQLEAAQSQIPWKVP